jgi:hypothetical protein
MALFEKATGKDFGVQGQGYCVSEYGEAEEYYLNRAVYYTGCD